MRPINCLIIDDEPVAREGVKMFAEQMDFLSVAGLFANPVEANSFIQQQKIDLIFLDIQMPRMTGLDFLKILKDPPMVIIITAYPNFALEGYEMDVIDYLVKPVSIERFVKAANKARDYFQLLNKENDPERKNESPYIFIKCDKQFEKIMFEDILYIEGMQNYVKIYTETGKYITYISIKSLMDHLPGHSFVRVHKSFLVAKAKVDAIRGNEVLIGDATIPLSRKNKAEIMNQILGDSLIN